MCTRSICCGTLWMWVFIEFPIRSCFFLQMYLWWFRMFYLMMMVIPFMKHCFIAHTTHNIFLLSKKKKKSENIGKIFSLWLCSFHNKWMFLCWGKNLKFYFFCVSRSILMESWNVINLLFSLSFFSTSLQLQNSLFSMLFLCYEKNPSWSEFMRI